MRIFIDKTEKICYNYLVSPHLFYIYAAEHPRMPSALMGGSMKYCFILNPAAGRGDLQDKIRSAIEGLTEDRKRDVELYLTVGVNDASEYVRRRVALDPLEEYRFYACGGDGTLCEVVNGVMALSERSRISVGVIPS